MSHATASTTVSRLDSRQHRRRQQTPARNASRQARSFGTKPHSQHPIRLINIARASDGVIRVDRYQHLCQRRSLYQNKQRNSLRVPSLISDKSLPDEEPELPSDTGVWRSPYEEIYATGAKANTQHRQTSTKHICLVRSSKNKEEEPEIPGDDEEDLTCRKRLVRFLRRSRQQGSIVQCFKGLPTPPLSPLSETQFNP